MHYYCDECGAIWNDDNLAGTGTNCPDCEVMLNPLDHCDPQVIALAKHLGCDPDDIKERIGPYYQCGKQEYFVGDYDYARESALDSCEDFASQFLRDVPEMLRSHVDTRAYAEDVVRYDGVAHVLATYDGHEYIEEVGGTEYYIYRTN